MTSYVKKIFRALLLATGVLVLTACSKTVEWKEEVQLNDGRIIVVTQKKRCEGGDFNAKTNATCIAREAWLTLTLPEISDKEIIWHETLDPLVVNIHEGRLYVIGYPPHTTEFRAYGATNPPYFGFVWNNQKWERIPFNKIPLQLYDTNMLIESIPSTKKMLVTIARKKDYVNNETSVFKKFLFRIDPSHTTSAY